MAKRRKSKVESIVRCYQCRNVIKLKPFYITGYTNREFCCSECKDVYFAFGNLDITETPTVMMKKIIYLWTILCSVESSNNPQAIGDGGDAFGIVQIHIKYVEDVNKFYETNYVHRDAFDVTKSKDMFKKYLEYWGNHYVKKTGKEISLEVLSRIHNGGPYGWKNDKTIPYWEKVLSGIRGERKI